MQLVSRCVSHCAHARVRVLQYFNMGPTVSTIHCMSVQVGVFCRGKQGWGYGGAWFGRPTRHPHTVTLLSSSDPSNPSSRKENSHYLSRADPAKRRVFACLHLHGLHAVHLHDLRELKRSRAKQDCPGRLEGYIGFRCFWYSTTATIGQKGCEVGVFTACTMFSGENNTNTNYIVVLWNASQYIYIYIYFA